ncbi:MAG: hypothetical protein B6D65_00495 [candidate division Zixibacteria bacterium 4484_93]|nr:MAG: hypothetical protein B6D65_00495 [candidate division Zixibacteria bacterium 4484_93]
MNFDEELFNRLPLYVFDVDSKGKVVWQNRRAEKSLGDTRGRKLWSLFFRERKDCPWDRIDSLPQGSSWEFIDKTGSYFCGQCLASPEAGHYLFLFENITEKLVEFCPCGGLKEILIIFTERGEIIFTNEQFYRKLGYERGKLNIQDIILPQDRTLFFDRLSECIKGGGEQFKLRLQGVSRNIYGYNVSLDCNVHDDKRLLAMTCRELESGDITTAMQIATLGLVASSVAHDLNNFLVGILGYTSYLKTDIDKDTELYGMVDTIENSAKGANELIKKTIAYASSFKENFSLVNLNNIVREIIMLKRGDILSDIKIKLELAHPINNIIGSSTELKYALLHLTENALEAMRGGGTLTIKTETIRVKEKEKKIPPAGNYIVLSVEDTGKGIPEDKIDAVVSPFFSKENRFGLGLTLVSAVARYHGGYLNIQSKENEGTVVRMYFPIPEFEMESNKRAAARGNILIIDDSAGTRTVLEKILVRQGFEVFLAPDGGSGVELFRKKKDKIDLVMLDITLPDANGREILVQLKGIDQDVNVIILTGYSMDETIREMLASGAQGYIRKPFLVDEVTLTIENILGTNGKE